MFPEIGEILISKQEIRGRVEALAAEITDCYPNRDQGIAVVGILTGCFIFLADLIRHLPIRSSIHLVRVSSYPGAATTSHGAKVIETDLTEVRGRDVLVVDGIVDSGGTLLAIRPILEQAGAKSIRTVVLLRKPDKLDPEVEVDHVGFDIEDKFVVGYGMDYDGAYRHLPDVGVLDPEACGQQQALL